ncbi:MAG TPA: VOC family protein [Microbacteriaceae bacterium]|nr:VOC family protein [Microbacteriaceae bacterium]
MPEIQPKITPMLWFATEAVEAAQFYTSTFPDSTLGRVFHAPGDSPGGTAGQVLSVDFTIAGMPFVALNGGPEFTFSEAVSFVILTDDQKETDYYWDALTADGGEESVCGWLKDRFGLSWQVTPRRMLELTQSEDPGVAARTFAAMLTMQKIDIAALEAAAAGTA